MRAYHVQVAAVHIPLRTHVHMTAPAPMDRGQLCFGAAKGPATWRADVDGPWPGGYWVEIKGGRDDGRVFVLTKDSIGAGLTEGDFCTVVMQDSGGARCVPLASSDEEVSASFSSFGDARRSRLRRVVEASTLPASITACIVLAAAVLMVQFAPTPDAAEARERCDRLISGAVNMGDRRAAEKWLAMCNMAPGEADELLDQAWRLQWGEAGPPRMVQGIAER